MGEVTSGFAGPRYQLVDEDHPAPEGAYTFEAFYSVNDTLIPGKFYYSTTGGHYIDHGAKWKKPEDGRGHWKVLNFNASGSQIAKAKSLGLAFAYCYDRSSGGAISETIPGGEVTYNTETEGKTIVTWNARTSSSCWGYRLVVTTKETVEGKDDPVVKSYQVVNLVGKDNHSYEIEHAENETITITVQALFKSENSNTALTVNGNYYTIDASEKNVPLIVTGTASSAGNVVNTYWIQNVQAAVFANHGVDTSAHLDSDGNEHNDAMVTFKNLTIYGNTGNTSKYYSGTDEDIRTAMEAQSGGINGFFAATWGENATPSAVSADTQLKGGYSAEAAGDGNYYAYVPNATSKIVLESVNIYNTLIAVFDNSWVDMSYVRIDNTWANSIYGHGAVRDTVLEMDHVWIGSSGGGSIWPEDVTKAFNPTVDIDYSTVGVENWVSGEEPWFKGYSMEIIVMGMKSMFESSLNPNHLTILKPVEVNGHQSYQLNFVFMSKCDCGSAADITYCDIEQLVDTNAFVVQPIMSIADGASMDFMLLFSKTGGKNFAYFKLYQGEMGQVLIGMVEILPYAG